ncbi:sulfurtransferase complex subunit TusC [Pseudomonas fluorescens]|uniref:sulfurtransferase complex subunit TusC n=1 Tax=Pseudomonas TaxID=286 RepID=UPI00048194B5|nr:sulfurtransferase complex subunit TusC [Pseudomonas sp. Pse1]
MPKSLLIVSRQAPWSGPTAREALDIVLAGGAFDLPIGLLFLDDGVFQLASGQNAKALQQKDLSANLQALGLFGIDELFACADSASARGLKPDTLSLDELQLLDAGQISAVIDRFDQVITL